MDTFMLDVEFVDADQPFTAAPKTARLVVEAETVCAAELIALQVVAADGRKPVRVDVDWENF